LSSRAGGGCNNGQTRQEEIRQGKTAEGEARFSGFGSQQSGGLDSLRSPESKRGYRHAIDEFIQWYCSEPRLSFNTKALF
jgi:hypothetical protein